MTARNRWPGAIALALTLALAPAPMARATPLDARSLGMGRAQLAVSDTASMAWTNAALLALPASHSAQLMLPGLALGFGNDVFSFGQIDQLLSGQSLSDADTQSIVSSIPRTGLGFKADLGVVPLSLSLPALHSGLFVRGSLDTLGVNIPRDLATLLFQGNVNTTQVTVDSLQGIRLDGFTDAGLAFAQPIPLKGTKATSLGLTVRGIVAAGFAQVTQASGSIYQVNPDGSISGSANATYRYAYGTDLNSVGLGGAVDLSFATDVRDDLRLVGSVSNLGMVHWPKITEKTSTFTLKPLSMGFTGSGNQFKFTPPDTTSSTTDGPNNGKELWERLPAQVAMGTQFKPIKRLPWVVDGDVSIGTGRGYGISTQPELHIGSELRPIQWLPIRTGMSTGGERPSIFSFGLGLELAHSRVDFAFGSFNGLFASSKGAYYALSSQLNF